jgi:hypothetical protein
MKTKTIIAAAAAVLALGAADAHAATPVVPQAAPALTMGVPGDAKPSRSGRTQYLMIGDSLTAGIMDRMPSYLPGWKVGMNGLGGRPLEIGMDFLASYSLPRDGRIVLAMGLFTNNAPGDFPELRSAVRESLRRVGDRGCVIWATVYRPAVGGPSWEPAWTPQEQMGQGYAAVNAWLRGMARENANMRLVDWSKSLHRSPIAMDVTGVHPATAAGWGRRAAMFADAARSC